MTGGSSIFFNLTYTQFLTLKYHNHLMLTQNTLLDFSQIEKYTRIECYEENLRAWFGTITLGNIKFSKSFRIADYTNLLVVNSFSIIEDVTEAKDERGYIELYSKNIQIDYNA